MAGFICNTCMFFGVPSPSWLRVAGFQWHYLTARGAAQQPSKSSCHNFIYLFIYMNSCCAPHLQMNRKCFTMAAIVLLSLHLCSSCRQLWLRDCSFTQRVLNTHRSGYSAVWLLHGWCQVKLWPSQRKFCVHTTHSKPHTLDACVFSCNLPPALLAEWSGAFTCCCSIEGVEQLLEWDSAQKVDPGEDNSPAAPSGTWTWDLLLMSLSF